MVTDRGRSDEAQAFDDVTQQTCLAHLLRSISDVLATKQGRARDVGERLKVLLQDALQLWHTFHAGEGADLATQAHPLWDAITYHLRPRLLTDPDNQRLLKGIGRHPDRGNVLRCLEAPRIAPTNNRAERVLRPAVIARKGSQCSKNPAGAQAFAACKSVVQTLAKQGRGSLVEGLSRLFRSTQLHAASPSLSIESKPLINYLESFTTEVPPIDMARAENFYRVRDNQWADGRHYILKL
jgi:hypothetical protein